MKGSTQEPIVSEHVVYIMISTRYLFVYANTTICCKEYFAFLNVNSISNLRIELVAEITPICL